MRDDLEIEVSLPELAQHHLDVNYTKERMKQIQEGLISILRGEEDRYNERYVKVVK